MNKERDRKTGVEPHQTDLRFLKIVDYVIEKNSAIGKKPNSDNSISQTIFGDRKIIAKIRVSQRHISVPQLEKFATYFNIDYNCFFRDTHIIEYDPNNIGKPTNQVKKNGFNAEVNGNNNIVGHGNVNGNIKVGKIDTMIQNAEKIINQNMNSNQGKAFKKVIHSIRDEAQNLEATILEKTEDIKKMTEIYEAKIAAEKEKVTKLEKALENSRNEERELTKKYMTLLEKSSGLSY